MRRLARGPCVVVSKVPWITRAKLRPACRSRGAREGRVRATLSRPLPCVVA